MANAATRNEPGELSATSSSEFDCEHCGACCHQRPGTILVEAADLLRWKRAGRDDLVAATEPGHFGMQAFKMKSGACVHLGTEHNPAACRIYPDRATVCREFEAGSRQCLEFRRERGLAEGNGDNHVT